MMRPAKEKKRQGKRRVLNALVYCLVLLAVFLGLIAAWMRYSQGGRPGETASEPGDAVERQIEAFTPNLGTLGSWINAGGPPQYTPAAATCRFVCAQCRSRCWMRAGRGCPACPFCGRVMARQGPGPDPGVAGGWSQAGGLPQSTPAAPMCRFFCAQCQWSCWAPLGGRPPVCPYCGLLMTRQGPGASPVGGAVAGGAAQIETKALWRGVAAPFDRQAQGALRGLEWAPPIAPGAVRPTLIKEFGVEVRPAGGAGAEVTGVMGNSFASNAGLRAGDVIIGCNGTPVRGVEQFQRRVSRAPPETDAQIKILRNGRTRDLLIMVGEGEMEGFTPIQRP